MLARPPDIVEKLARDLSVKRRCRLIQDNQARRLRQHGEGARNLHHLPGARREVPHHGVQSDIVPGEDRVERLADHPSRDTRPSQAFQLAMCQPGILDDCEGRAERWLLEDRANAIAVGLSNPIIRGHGPAVDGECPIAPRHSAAQHAHQRRFAGTVVAHDPDKLRPAYVQMDATQGLHLAKAFTDAAHCDDRCGARHFEIVSTASVMLGFYCAARLGAGAGGGAFPALAASMKASVHF